MEVSILEIFSKIRTEIIKKIIDIGITYTFFFWSALPLKFKMTKIKAMQTLYNKNQDKI